MMDTIRSYVIGLVALALVAGFAYLKWELYDVRKEYREYKTNIEDQVRMAKAKAEATRLEQEAKYEKAKQDYAASQSALELALAGLRYTGDMSRQEGLRVAGCSCSTVPPKAGDPGSAGTASSAEAGIRQTAFYADAMRDVLQCQRLIEFVR